jgi:hypothetical protein
LGAGEACACASTPSTRFAASPSAFRPLYLGGGSRPVYRLTFGNRSARTGTVLSRAGAPRVKITGRRVSVVSLPSRVGIIKLQLVKRGRAVRRLRGRTTLFAQVLTAAGRQNLRVRIGPKRH